MKLLMRGGESAERVALLVAGTRICSPSVINALNSYLCSGRSQCIAASCSGVSVQQLNRGIQRLEKLAAIIEEIKALDWQHLSSDK